MAFTSFTRFKYRSQLLKTIMNKFDSKLTWIDRRFRQDGRILQLAALN